MPCSRLFYMAIISILLFTPNISVAQNSDSAKSLGDILNPKPKDDSVPLTAEIMANNYYKKCIDEKSYAFDDVEKDILCSCTAAKMSENLSVKDFQNLDKKTPKGKDARGRMLAYSYAPCMEYAIDKKVSTDCYVSRKLDDIITGKSLICKCVSDHFKRHVSLDAPHMITTYMLNEPMGLNPLEGYLTTKSYDMQHEVFMRQCRFKFEHARDNKR